MNLIEVIDGPISIPAGNIFKLDNSQLKKRENVMEPVGKDSFYSVGVTHWKNGEIIETMWIVPKEMIRRVNIHNEITDNLMEKESNISNSSDLIKAMVELRVADLVPKIPELTMNELNELSLLDPRVTIQNEIKKAIEALSVKAEKEAIIRSAESVDKEEDYSGSFGE